MKTRLLRPEENWKSNLTMAVAFEGDYDLEKKESAARERTEEEKGKTPATAASAHF